MRGMPLVSGGSLEGREGFEPSTPGLKVREPFGPYSTLAAESKGKVRWRSARTNPAVLPAWHLTTGLYGVLRAAARRVSYDSRRLLAAQTPPASSRTPPAASAHHQAAMLLSGPG